MTYNYPEMEFSPGEIIAGLAVLDDEVAALETKLQRDPRLDTREARVRLGELYMLQQKFAFMAKGVVRG